MTMSAEDATSFSAPRPLVAADHSFTSVSLRRVTLASRAGTSDGSSLVVTPSSPAIGSTASMRAAPSLLTHRSSDPPRAATLLARRRPRRGRPGGRVERPSIPYSIVRRGPRRGCFRTGALFGVLHGARLADDRDLDLTRVL